MLIPIFINRFCYNTLIVCSPKSNQNLISLNLWISNTHRYTVEFEISHALCSISLSEQSPPPTASPTAEARSGRPIRQNLHQSPFHSAMARNQRILRYRSTAETESLHRLCREHVVYVAGDERLAGKHSVLSGPMALLDSLFSPGRSSQTTKARPCSATFQASTVVAHLELALFLTRFLYLKISSPLQILTYFLLFFCSKIPHFFSFPWVWYLV